MGYYFDEKVDDIFKILKPVLGEKKVNILWTLYHSDTGQKGFIESLAHYLSLKYLGESYEKKSILLPPIPKELAKGGYPLGHIIYRESEKYVFFLRHEEWTNHIAIFGRSGSGKTNAGYIIIWNLLRAGKPFLIFDWKRNYRDLLQKESNLRIYTIGRSVSPLFWNPLIPPKEIPPSIWLRKLIEILCHAYYLGEGVSYLLMQAIDSVFRESGVYDNNAGEYPCFIDIFDRIKRLKATGREAQWLDSTKRTLAVLCFGEFGRALNVRTKSPVEAILNQNIILELDGLTKSDKTFFTEALLLWIHNYRLCQGKRESFKHAILIEEAHHILLRKKQEMQGEETITDLILREIRELGESIILIDQHPSLISKTALGNTYTTIAMNLKHGSDIHSIFDSLLLTQDQKEYLGILPVGQAIVKLQGRWFKPFLIKFPKYRLKKGITTDEDIKSKMASYSGRITQTGISPAEPEKYELIRGMEEKRENMSEYLRLLLQDVIDHPYSGMVERYMRLGFTRYRGNKIKNELISKGLAKAETVKNREGRLRILSATPEGFRLGGCRMRPGRAGGGRPGMAHEYWKERIAGFYRSLGYKVDVEKDIGGRKAADIAAEKDGTLLAIEIETGKSDTLFNIKKDLDAGFDKVVCVALDRETKAKIKRLLAQGFDGSDKVAVMSLEDFFRG